MTTLTSPVGQIWFLAANNPVTNKKTGKQQYSIGLIFDSKEAAEWITQLTEINEALVTTAETYKIRGGKNKALKALLDSGKVKVEARTKFKPLLFDSKGNELDSAPYFFSESTGTAQMIVETFDSEEGGGIKLEGIMIHNIDTPEGAGGMTPEERAAKLREIAAKMAK